MQVPIGGIAREPYGMIRFDSGADSIVWMEEDKTDNRNTIFFLQYDTPET